MLFSKVKEKIDAKKKTQITKDWLAEFPEYKKFRPCCIKKRCGPLSFNIGYEVKYSVEYRPGSSWCNLLNAPKETYAALHTHPKSRRRDLTWEHHERGLYKEAVQELKDLSPFPLEGPLTLSQVIKAYDIYRGSSGPYRHELEDPSLIAAWAGKTALAKELAEKYFQEWHERLILKEKETGQKFPVTPLEELKIFLERLKSPEELQHHLEEQVKRLGLEKIPYYDLIIDID